MRRRRRRLRYRPVILPLAALPLAAADEASQTAKAAPAYGPSPYRTPPLSGSCLPASPGPRTHVNTSGFTTAAEQLSASWPMLYVPIPPGSTCTPDAAPAGSAVGPPRRAASGSSAFSSVWRKSWVFRKCPAIIIIFLLENFKINNYNLIDDWTGLSRMLSSWVAIIIPEFSSEILQHARVCRNCNKIFF